MRRFLTMLVVIGCVGWAPALTGSVGATRHDAKAPDALARVSGAWVPISAADPVFAGAQVTTLVATGDALVAAGSVGSGYALWTSPDGLDWTRVPDAALGLTPEQLALPGNDGAYRELLVAGDDRSVMVMIGRSVLSSRDGRTWETVATAASGTALRDPARRNDLGPTPEFVDWYLNALAIDGGDAAAVGYGCWCATMNTGNHTPFALSSVDSGARWSGAPFTAYLPDQGELYDVVSTPEGFVAAGRDMRATGEDAGIWRSPDGAAWTKVEHADLSGPIVERINMLAADGNRVLGLGSESAPSSSSRTSLFFRSDDAGVTWTRYAADPAVFGTTSPRAVFPLGAGFVASGSSIPPGYTAPRATLFTSTDGASWTAAWAPPDGNMFPIGIADRPGGVVTILARPAIGAQPPAAKVYVTGTLAKKAVRAGLAPTPTTLPRATGTTISR